MIELGILNENTKEKYELAQQLKEFGMSDEEISIVIEKAERETIKREKATEENNHNT